MVLRSEKEAHAFVLLMHLRTMTARLRQLPPDKWDWTYAPPAPTPRTLATHTLSWLQCDRQHIRQPSAREHSPIAEPSRDTTELCDALDAEAGEWEALLNDLTDEDLARESCQFDFPGAEMNVRGFVAHMVQNVIYKHGQFSTIFFALGLDGEGTYEAPFPNAIYRDALGIGAAK